MVSKMQDRLHVRGLRILLVANLILTLLLALAVVGLYCREPLPPAASAVKETHVEGVSTAESVPDREHRLDEVARRVEGLAQVMDQLTAQSPTERSAVEPTRTSHPLTPSEFEAQYGDTVLRIVLADRELRDRQASMDSAARAAASRFELDADDQRLRTILREDLIRREEIRQEHRPGGYDAPYLHGWPAWEQAWREHRAWLRDACRDVYGQAIGAQLSWYIDAGGILGEEPPPGW